MAQERFWLFPRRLTDGGGRESSNGLLDKSPKASLAAAPEDDEAAALASEPEETAVDQAS